MTPEERKKRVREWYWRTREARLAYKRKWQHEHLEIENKRKREWENSNIEYVRYYRTNWSKKYYSENKERVNGIKLKWASANPDKVKCHRLLNNAVRRGEIKRPSACSICSNEGMIHAHHEDYTKPLDVMWLCATCHTSKHQAEEVICSHS